MRLPPVAERGYFADVQVQPLPQVQRFSQAQRTPQRQASAVVQPQLFFAQRQSVLDVIVPFLVGGGRRSCPLSLTGDAGPAVALHLVRRDGWELARAPLASRSRAAAEDCD